MKKQIVSILAILMLIGCASNKPIDVPPSDEYTLYARGLSTTLGIEGNADRQAILMARNELASAIETHITSLTKTASEQVGIGNDSELNDLFSQAIKATVKQTLEFSVLHSAKPTKKVKGAYRAEKVYKVNIGPINEQMMENIKKRQNLYERFRTSELFNELEEEIEKDK